VLVLWVSSSPSRAHACSCVAEAIGRSEPADGAVDVPIDIAPVVHGWLDPTTIVFEREDGTPVEFALRTGPGLNPCEGVTGELVPESPLAANSRYVIRASPPVEDEGSSEVWFTTGEATVPEIPLAAPEVAVSFVRGNLIVAGCVSDVRGCLTVTGADHAELRATRGDGEQIWTFVRGTVVLNSLLDGAPDCIEVRARDAAGRRSAASTLCADDFAIRDTVESDYDEGELRCSDGVVGDRDVEPTGTFDGGAGDDTSRDASVESRDASVQPRDSAMPGEADSEHDGSAEERDGGDAQRDPSRTEVDMSDGGCTAAGAASGPPSSSALLLALLALRRRARHRNV
jgi:uncharacterized protein (TIGR03382 family)